MNAEEWLKSQWYELRNQREWADLAFVKGAIALAKDIELLTDDQAELWYRRIETCPGHDDEGGRNWCSYCGSMQDCPCGRPGGPGGTHDEDWHDFERSRYDEE